MTKNFEVMFSSLTDPEPAYFIGSSYCSPFPILVPLKEFLHLHKVLLITMVEGLNSYDVFGEGKSSGVS